MRGLEGHHPAPSIQASARLRQLSHTRWFPPSAMGGFDPAGARAISRQRGTSPTVPLPLSARSCRCGRSLHVFGHHRAACGTAGVLGRRGWVLENMAARVPRGRRTRPSERFRPGHGLSRFQPVGRPQVGSGRRVTALEWRTAGHRYHNGFASETGRHSTGWHSNNKREGFGRRARSQKARRYPELSGENRARLVVMGTEVGGRWSAEAATFLSSLATAKARDAPLALGGSVWLRRWQGMLGCAAARAFAQSLLEGPASGGVDGPTPLHERRAG